MQNVDLVKAEKDVKKLEKWTRWRIKGTDSPGWHAGALLSSVFFTVA